MKKEILRIHDFNMEYSSTVKLTNISMSLMAGECIGFLGLMNSGKNLLVDILCKGENLNQRSFYVNQRIVNCADIQKSVYRIATSNYLIDNWTVGEYICLDSVSSILGIYWKNRLAAKTELFLKHLKLDIDVNKKLGDLSGLEKRLIDLVKAYSLEKKIIVIEDEFQGCSIEDIKQFKEVLNRVINNRMVVIINSHSDYVSNILSDKYIIFKKGYIVKKCNKEYIKDNNHLEKFLLGARITSKKKDLDSYKNEQNIISQVIYSVKNVRLKIRDDIHLDFAKSEVVTILILDVNEKEQFFDLISGRYIDKYMKIYLEQNICNFSNVTDFVKKKIVSIADMGGVDELLLSMSDGDNLWIPSLDKISSLQYIFSQHRMDKMLKKQMKGNIEETGNDIKNMSINDHIILLLERWYIYKPKVLILLEPFVHCDIYGVSLVKSYIKKFTSLGTTVIIVKSREEYIADISDRIIHIK
ncbi:ribose import ATP-binding protein RbsA [Vallitalea longa]|uniref:Ribose import ATP-binding protein RbsA n=1 Tax=Vallitalea longa TaxID=2936439 RepID=A0A9W5Y7D0_9FIRM|nr:ATP-binding cassette domain-containing protein [Vallitalea longa]GKX27672.1 ribose import ATP-binding protein RbsA [Vallitalea longa]